MMLMAPRCSFLTRPSVGKWPQCPLRRGLSFSVRDVLRQVQEGNLSAEHGEDLIMRRSSAFRSPVDTAKLSPEETLNSFANLDHTRAVRTGFPEVVFAQGKTPEQLAAILDDMARHVNESTYHDDIGSGIAASTAILATRVSPEQYEHFRSFEMQHGKAIYHEVAGIISMTASSQEEQVPSGPSGKSGKIIIACAGTTDVPVAEEAAVTLEAAGCSVDRIYDVGVAGLHRIVRVLPRLRDPSVGCVIVCAGMDGALPSVVGGLVSVPVIACPTSVGYGVAFGGVSAMLTMLNSCAPGVGVVNIDNGFGAAALAYKCIR